MRRIAETIAWIRASSETQRATQEFQRRLWEDNNIAAIGQGNIGVDEALADEGFRKWLSSKSMELLPLPGEARLRFLTAIYEDLKTKLEALLTRDKTPHLEIFRVMAALYPEGMTTVASTDGWTRLPERWAAITPRTCRASRMGSSANRLVLGDLSREPLALAERMSIPWISTSGSSDRRMRQLGLRKNPR